MRLRCIDSSATSLPSHYHAKFTAKASPQYRWPLTVGKEYMAAAVGVFRGCAVYLVRTDERMCPEFVPAPLFRLVDGRLSSQWRLWANEQYTEYTLDFVAGYLELADGSSHLDDLLDGKPEAVELFLERLSEMENELQRE